MEPNISPEFDLFLSYASPDRSAAEDLETWLQSAPRSKKVWRDRRTIPPGAPDYYQPILEGIAASGAFLLLLSPHWLRSVVAAREFADALSAGKKMLPVVHPAIPRDPSEAEGRFRKSELMETLSAFSLATELSRFNWIWPTANEAAHTDFSAIEGALATDFIWAYKHAIIVQRLNRWKAIGNPSALLRGQELAELMAEAFAEAKNREPVLTPEQRAFLQESQRHEGVELSRIEGLYWGAQARAAAFAASERAELEPDLALLLAAEAVGVAPVPEAYASLLSLLHRHAALTKVVQAHGRSRWTSGMAFSADGRWVASIDRGIGLNDDRRPSLLIHDSDTGRERLRLPVEGRLSAVAWGERWLAVASTGFINWVRWDDEREKFRGNTATSLNSSADPDFLAFCPAEWSPVQAELLAWAARNGEFGVIRVGDHQGFSGRLGGGSSTLQLTGLGWLEDGRLITAEGGRIVVRSSPNYAVTEEIIRCHRVLSLVSDHGNWVAVCVTDSGLGVLSGRGNQIHRLLPAPDQDLEFLATGCGMAEQQQLLVASAIQRSGNPAVAIWHPNAKVEVLLQGDAELMRCLAADSAGHTVGSGSTEGRVWLWDRRRKSHLVSRVMPNELFSRVTTSSCGAIAGVTTDGRVIRFTTDLAKPPEVLTPPPFDPDRLLFSDGGRLLLAQAVDGRLATLAADGIWMEVTLPSGFALDPGLAVATGLPVVAVRSSDRAISLLRLTGGTLQQITTFEIENPVKALALNDRATWLIYAVNEGFIRLKARRTDQPEQDPLELGSLRNGSLQVPIACSGEEGVAVGDGTDMVLGNLADPDQEIRLSEHDNPIKGIASSKDLLATYACSFQNTDVDQIRLWTADGKSLGPITMPDHLRTIAFTGEGGPLLALGQKGELWRIVLSREELSSIARRIAGRKMTAEELRRYGMDAWQARSPAR